MENETTITITEVDNGYIVTYAGNHSIFESSDPMDDRPGITKTLEHVVGLLGYPYDKWSENNVNITWDRKGHKHE
jgi:hypothetical protein